MSNIDSLLDNVRAAYARLAEVEMVAEAHPGDRLVLASVGSIKAHARQLEDQWLEECRSQQIEVCRYKLQPKSESRYLATAFARSLLDFQELIAQLFDAGINGPKQRARITGEILTESAFSFGYTFPGSLGVVLTMQDSPDLFKGKFESTVAAFQRVTSLETEGDVRLAAQQLGDAVIKKIYDWSLSNYTNDYNVDITWIGRNGIRSGAVVPKERLGRIVDIILRTSDKERRTIRVIGSLVMIDVKRSRFRFVVPEGDDYPGIISNEFELTKQWSVNKTYVAEILVESVTKYATQKTETIYTLEKLTEFIA